MRRVAATSTPASRDEFPRDGPRLRCGGGLASTVPYRACDVVRGIEGVRRALHRFDERGPAAPMRFEPGECRDDGAFRGRPIAATLPGDVLVQFAEFRQFRRLVRLVPGVAGDAAGLRYGRLRRHPREPVAVFAPQRNASEHSQVVRLRFRR